MTSWWKRVRYLLALVGLCAIATCPTAERSCAAKQHAQEADDLLAVIGDRVARTVAATGKVPATPAGPTPQPSCCEQGGTCTPNAQTWTAAGWRELEFSIDNPYRYTYEYLPEPGGGAAIVRATGDLDCNGDKSRYELRLVVKGTTVERAWTRKDPYE